jgi:hypothetical protein
LDGLLNLIAYELAQKIEAREVSAREAAEAMPQTPHD